MPAGRAGRFVDGYRLEDGAIQPGMEMYKWDPGDGVTSILLKVPYPAPKMVGWTLHDAQPDMARWTRIF